MTGKSRQAVLIGMGLWSAGACGLVLLGPLSGFPTIAPGVTLLLTPLVMYALTKFHLRDVARTRRAETGLRLGILATATQFPLDAVGFLSIFRLSYPELTPAAQQATILALQLP